MSAIGNQPLGTPIQSGLHREPLRAPTGALPVSIPVLGKHDDRAVIFLHQTPGDNSHDALAKSGISNNDGRLVESLRNGSLRHLGLPGGFILSLLVDFVQPDNPFPQKLFILTEKELADNRDILIHAGNGVNHGGDAESNAVLGVNCFQFQQFGDNPEEGSLPVVHQPQTLLNDGPILAHQRHHVGDRAQRRQVDRLHHRLYTDTHAHIQLQHNAPDDARPTVILVLCVRFIRPLRVNHRVGNRQGLARFMVVRYHHFQPQLLCPGHSSDAADAIVHCKQHLCCRILRHHIVNTVGTDAKSIDCPLVAVTVDLRPQDCQALHRNGPSCAAVHIVVLIDSNRFLVPDRVFQDFQGWLRSKERGAGPDGFRQGREEKLLHCLRSLDAAFIQDIQAGRMDRLQAGRQGKRFRAVRVIELILCHPTNTPIAPRTDVETYMHAKITTRNSIYWVTML